MFELQVVVVATLAGAVAAVSGFGIGSLLTPVLSLRYGTAVAVVLVSLPHFLGTAVRLTKLWRQIDRTVLLRFGVLSAVGGLAGAWVHARVRVSALTLVLGLLLVFAGIATATGLSRRMRFGRRTAWVAGAVSGFFGGLVGNQGGMRSAALFGFDVDKRAFVATATAIGALVDAARVPVYVVTEWPAMVDAAETVALSIAGVLVGTVWGVRLLERIPERLFRPGLGVLVLALGVFMLVQALKGSAR